MVNDLICLHHPMPQTAEKMEALVDDSIIVILSMTVLPVAAAQRLACLLNCSMVQARVGLQENLSCIGRNHPITLSCCDIRRLSNHPMFQGC